MCITGYGTMENPIHSLWKSKSSFPTSCKQGFPQFHERSQFYDIPTMPAPTESTPLSISFIRIFFYKSIPALSAKSAFRPISIDCFSSGRLSNAPLYPFSNKGVLFAIPATILQTMPCCLYKFHLPQNHAAAYSISASQNRICRHQPLQCPPFRTAP